MIWFFLVLLIFWKPIYWGVYYLYLKYKKADNEEYVTKIRDWFRQLWDLIKLGDQ